MISIYERALEFKKKYTRTIAWRIKKNSSVIEKYLGNTEKVLYVFVGQKNNNPLDILSTCVVALTNERIIIGRKRVIFGYFFDSVTPDMFNDLKVLTGVFWGRIHIDTAREFITISNLDKRALPEVEQVVRDCMQTKKKEILEKKEFR